MVGQPVRTIAVVVAAPGSLLTPSGEVTFFDGLTWIWLLAKTLPDATVPIAEQSIAKSTASSLDGRSILLAKMILKRVVVS